MVPELMFDEPRPGRPPRHLADLDAAGRASAVAELGLPAFRAKQLAHQYYGRLIADLRQMTDLPAAVRDRIAGAMFPNLLTASADITCDAGQTRKTLWRAVDGTMFESVLMRYPRRNTVCISSQAGCGMACPFCATGQGGLTRNLSTAEILEQVRAGAAALRDDFGDRLSNVVFMGMGGAAGQLRQGVGRSSAHYRAAAVRFRDFGPRGDGVDGGSGPCYPQPCRRAARRDPGAVAARPRRRVARYTSSGQQPVEDQRSARCGPVLRQCDRATGVY